MQLRHLAAPAWIIGLIATVLLLSWTGAGLLALPASTGIDRWLAETDSVVVVLSLLRAAAYVVACYLLACSGLAVMAQIFRSSTLASISHALTLPSVRRINRRVIEFSLVGALAVPSMASASPNEVDVPTLRSLTPAPPVTIAPLVAEPPLLPTTWTVARGDNLWTISETVMFERLGYPPSEQELTTYWLNLIAVNKPSLADPRNPDLIFAGQKILLP